jgi:hypothetical protein
MPAGNKWDSRNVRIEDGTLKKIDDQRFVAYTFYLIRLLL